MISESISVAVLEWYDHHGRKDLPWQQNPTPYRVWVSEIMLQQTQVATVRDYFQRFMHSFPDIQTLAAASEDDVLHHWAGLGYYSRARNLHRTAKILCTEYAGTFPHDVQALACLPGIGRSTAGAIASLAMDLCAPILDGNVKRVLARYHAIPGYPGKSAVAAQLWQLAKHHTPHHRVNHYTQAMMDLGATLCTRSRPLCLHCPLQLACQARRQGNPQDYPGRKARKTLPQKYCIMPLLVRQDRSILLYRRPPTGIWGGLWSLPELRTPDQLADLAQRYGLMLGDPQPLPSVCHTFSHFQLHIQPWLTPVQKMKNIAPTMAQDDLCWYSLTQPPPLGLAAPIKRLLQQTGNQLQRNTQ